MGRTLKPTKFGVTSTSPRDISPSTQPNEFGQVFSADEDRTAGHTPTSRESDHMHARSDLDAGAKSQHHTLGNGRNQSAPGDHIHDGVEGRKLGQLEMDPNNPGQTRAVLTIPTSATVADVVGLLHNFIEFREV